MLLEPLYQLDPAEAVQRWLCCPALDLPMATASIAGEGWFLVLMVIALAWRANGDRRDALRSAIRGLVVLAVIGAIVVVSKRFFGAPRPLQLLGAMRVRVLLEPLRQLSFPSGHSAASAAFALWASRGPPRRWWPWLFAFLVGLSRVYVGAHWVTDVIVGWSLGVVVAAAICRGSPLARDACVLRAEANEGAP
jgi:undecaprenyl-diphosphatase